MLGVACGQETTGPDAGRVKYFRGAVQGDSKDKGRYRRALRKNRKWTREWAG